MKPIIMIVVAVLIAFLAYLYVQDKFSSDSAIDTTASERFVFSEEELANIPPTYNDSVAITNAENSDALTIDPQTTAASPSPNFTCDGRQHCSQMRSCAEATYFNNYCPNTKMDGNNDGVPCEQQWCN